jgi:hypothetical protein
MIDVNRIRQQQGLDAQDTLINNENTCSEHKTANMSLAFD